MSTSATGRRRSSPGRPQKIPSRSTVSLRTLFRAEASRHGFDRGTHLFGEYTMPILFFSTSPFFQFFPIFTRSSRFSSSFLSFGKCIMQQPRNPIGQGTTRPREAASQRQDGSSDDGDGDEGHLASDLVPFWINDQRMMNPSKSSTFNKGVF